MTKTKVIFFGNERLVSGLDHTETPVLRSLIDTGYEVVAVVANDAGTKSRKVKKLEVAELAAAHDIPVYTPIKPMDIYDELAAHQADVAVLVAYGRIVPQKLIDLFPHGIVNIHPSLLPNYRGPSPIESVIANGDKTTGVSIMALSARMDAGPVYHQIEYNLPRHITAPDLARELADIAASELITTLPKILNGSLVPREQNESNATYCQLISKQDALLQPDIQTAEQAERLIRAYKAFPRARIVIDDKQLIILTASISDTATSALDIKFSDGRYVSIDELIAPSGKTMTADSYVKGYRAK